MADTLVVTQGVVILAVPGGCETINKTSIKRRHLLMRRPSVSSRAEQSGRQGTVGDLGKAKIPLALRMDDTVPANVQVF